MLAEDVCEVDAVEDADVLALVWLAELDAELLTEELRLVEADVLTEVVAASSASPRASHNT